MGMSARSLAWRQCYIFLELAAPSQSGYKESPANAARSGLPAPTTEALYDALPDAVRQVGNTVETEMQPAHRARYSMATRLSLVHSLRPLTVRAGILLSHSWTLPAAWAAHAHTDFLRFICAETGDHCRRHPWLPYATKTQHSHPTMDRVMRLPLVPVVHLVPFPFCTESCATCSAIVCCLFHIADSLKSSDLLREGYIRK